MLNFITSRTFTLPALILGSISLTACSGQGFGSGYGNSNHFAGANCAPAVQACGGRYGQGTYGSAQNMQAGYSSYGGQSMAQHGQKSRYGTSYQAAGYNQQMYAQPQIMQQQMMLRPAPYQQMSYQAAATPQYDVDIYTPTTSTVNTVAPANCPAGTTAQSDGTCLQGSSSISYASSTYTPPSYSPSTTAYSGGYMTSSTSTSGQTLSCPAGTTAQSDGTCLQGGGTNYTASTSTYSGPTYDGGSTSTTGIAPAIGTYDFGNYNWGSKDTTWGGDNYVSPGTRVVDSPSYPAAPTTDYSYQPIRK